MFYYKNKNRYYIWYCNYTSKSKILSFSKYICDSQQRLLTSCISVFQKVGHP